MNIQNELSKGSSSLRVLSVLGTGDMYGYQMIVELARRSDHTFEMKEGTLYPVLHSLERDGLVYSQRTTGRFVTEDQAMIASAKRSLAERHIQAFLEAMTHLGYGREEILTLLRQEETKGGEDNGSSGM